MQKSVPTEQTKPRVVQQTSEEMRVVTTIGGLQNWPGPHGETDRVSACIAADDANNVYVCTFRGEDSIIWMISQSGAIRALAVIDDSGTLIADPANRVSVKLVGDRISVEQTQQSASVRMTTVKHMGYGFLTQFVSEPMSTVKPRPASMAIDTRGNLYVSTKGIAVDDAGNIYVADKIIQKIAPDGVVAKIAGYLEGSNDGEGPDAQFKRPTGIAVDKSGNIYVADTGNGTIRRVTPAGVVTTLAGQPNFLGSTDSDKGRRETGRDPKATFFEPTSVAVDGKGNVYVADSAIAGIRMVGSNGTVTTIAGQRVNADYDRFHPGWADGPADKAKFDTPFGIAVNSDGNVYVADPGGTTGRGTIRKIATVQMLPESAPPSKQSASSLRPPTKASGMVATLAHDLLPIGAIAVDEIGNVYVGLCRRNWCGKIQKITPGGKVLTLSGTDTDLQRGEGVELRFSRPNGLAVDKAGNVYVTDIDKYGVLKIAVDGSLTGFAGNASSGFADGQGDRARFYQALGLAIDRLNNLYVADAFNHLIRKITPNGDVTTLAGRPGTMGCADGQGSSARFNNPSRLAVDSKGDVYVVEYARAVRKITPGGIVTTIAGEPSEPGLVNGQIGEARFNALRGIAVDNSGIVYVVDTDVIRAISPDGYVSTLSGKHRNSEGYVPDSYDNAVSPLSKARFDAPDGIAVDPAGKIYVADHGAVRVINLSCNIGL
jgi:sugar lactone lactonase YvrE